jgi:DNA repair protein RadC
LADQEVLALVLGHGLAGRPALEIARSLLVDVGGLHGLTRVPASRLARIAGVGAVQASRVVAAIELGRRTLLIPAAPKLALGSPDALGAFLLPRFGSHPVERFGVVMLDSRHRLIRALVVSEGALDRAPAVPRDVLREAMIEGAAAVVLFHNHPSGDPTPTNEDVLLTRRLVNAGSIVGIDVVDHIIVAESTYCSLRRARLW